MDPNFKNVEFEQFIKDSADQYRMYPSEKAWKGIYNVLHTRRRWFGLGFTFLLLTSSLVTIFVINSKKTDLKEISASYSGESVNAQNPTKELNSEITIDKNSTSKSIISSTPNQPGFLASKRAFNYSTANLTSPENENKITSEPFIERNQPAISQFADQVTNQATYKTGLINNTILDINPVDLEAKKPGQLSTNTLGLESAINSSQKAKKKSKIFFQIYFTPTISYRKLSENKSFLQAPAANVPFSYAALYNINNAVTHKPDMGLELGISGKYPVSKAVNVRAGLQFNMSRYEIKAFNYPGEIATIALTNGYRVESLNTISSYRNFNGGKADWLKNFYFQVSLPVGAELKLVGNDKIHFGVASTIQPTYVLGDRAYLISSDYKNYSEVPWLIRRWNVNTNLETYVAYSTGKLNWQVGPQIRYQLLSSFVDKYPVKENLFDFGLKVGVGLNK